MLASWVAQRKRRDQSLRGTTHTSSIPLAATLSDRLVTILPIVLSTMMMYTSLVSRHSNAAATFRSMPFFTQRSAVKVPVNTSFRASTHWQRPIIPSINHHHSCLSTGASSSCHTFVTASRSTTTMEYHTSTISKQADVMATTATTAPARTTLASVAWMNRWIVTAEVAVSKIFPGGFGWQTGSLVAANYYQYSSDSFNFALSTGVGDALGVFGGHCLYYYLKRSIVPSSKIDMVKEVHTGLWLGSAALCSGTVWQPIVTTLQLSGCTFTQVMIGTWLTCSTAFYVGLRVGRTLLPLCTLAKPTYDNSQTDIALSVSIGGATGFFVGTDTAYLPEQNFLLPVVGITDTTSDLMGCTLAGTSTALGFVSSQSVLNMIYPKQKCWND